MTFGRRPGNESPWNGDRLAKRREAQLAALDASLARGVAASEAGQGKSATEVASPYLRGGGPQIRTWTKRISVPYIARISARNASLKSGLKFHSVMPRLLNPQ